MSSLLMLFVVDVVAEFVVIVVVCVCCCRCCFSLFAFVVGVVLVDCDCRCFARVCALVLLPLLFFVCFFVVSLLLKLALWFLLVVDVNVAVVCASCCLCLASSLPLFVADEVACVCCGFLVCVRCC